MKFKISFILLFIVFNLLISISCNDDPVRSDKEITVTDIDGNVYQTVTIGSQMWMAENLKVTHYRNGDSILHVLDRSVWDVLSTGAYCGYNNDSSNIAIYGLLYNWYAVNDNRFIAPEGWHIATDEEWKQLEMYLGMSQTQADSTYYRGTNEGGKLKEFGTIHWFAPNEGATNESGFTALPGGLRGMNDTYYNIGASANFWTSIEFSSNRSWYRSLNVYFSEIIREAGVNILGISVRCVKDD